MEHLTFQEIYSIVEDQMQITVTEGHSSKNADRGRIEEHLAVCAKCRKIYLGLWAITDSLGQIWSEADASQNCQETEASPNCPEDWELAALMMGEGDHNQAEKLSAHLQDCTHCLERTAGYYKALESHREEKELVTPKAWKERAVKTLLVETALQDKREGFFHRVLFFIHKKLTLLPPLPGYVLAALAIAMLIWTNLPKGEKFIILDSSVRITERSSEISSTFGFMGKGNGFMGKGKKTAGVEERESTYSMKIKSKGEAIVFSWQPIEHISVYRFSIQETRREAMLFSQEELRQPQATIQKGLLEKGKLYTWIVEGEISEDEAPGGVTTKGEVLEDETTEGEVLEDETTEGEVLEYRGNFFLIQE